MALREPDLLDAHHPTTSALVLGAELLVGLAMGAAWARTTRVWVEADGSVWSRSTKASAAVWFAGIALRLGLFGLGALMGVHQAQFGPDAGTRGHPAGALRDPGPAGAVPAEARPGAGHGVR